MSLFWTWTFLLQNFNFALCLLFAQAVPWATALFSVVGTNTNMQFLGQMKCRKACKVTQHPAESGRKARYWDSCLLYLHWDNSPFPLCGTQQGLRDVTASSLGRWKVPSLVLLMVLPGLRTIAEVLMRRNLCLCETALALISQDVCCGASAVIIHTAWLETKIRLIKLL